MTREMMVGDVYLIHFERPVRPGQQHYTGFSTQLEHRLESHAAGEGSVLTRLAVAQGIPFEVVAVWRNVPRVVERQVKLDTLHLCSRCEAPGRRPSEQLMSTREPLADRPPVPAS